LSAQGGQAAAHPLSHGLFRDARDAGDLAVPELVQHVRLYRLALIVGKLGEQSLQRSRIDVGDVIEVIPQTR
jgi:hypothetical protein